jgi:hypothetical protein
MRWADLIALPPRKQGSRSVNLTAPTTLTGAYAADNGVVLLQDPASGAPVSFSGLGAVTLSGLVYAPSAAVSIISSASVSDQGNPITGLQAQLIAADLSVSNTASLTLSVGTGMPPPMTSIRDETVGSDGLGQCPPPQRRGRGPAAAQ